jgi:DNA-binding NtrC family response regulator
LATVLLIGSNAGLLEGIAQSLAATGYSTRVVTTVAEGAETAAGEYPLVAVVQRHLALADPRAAHLPLGQGGALLLYRTDTDEPSTLTPTLQRAALADLTLPLERHRLVALIQRIVERAQATGRGRRHTPPEQRAP